MSDFFNSRMETADFRQNLPECLAEAPIRIIHTTRNRCNPQCCAVPGILARQFH